MLTALNWMSRSGDQPENKLPNEYDEVYFQLINKDKGYYKGRFINNNFYVEWQEKSYSIKEVSYWVLTSDPTCFERIAIIPDREYFFYRGPWELVTEDNQPYIYHECLDGVDIKDLNLSKEVEILVREWVDFFHLHITDDFQIVDPITRHNFDQYGLFVYEQVRLDLLGKYYLIYYPFNDDFSSDEHNFPFYVDNNEGQIEWKFINKKLPKVNEPIRFQLDSYIGEFYKGIFNKTAFVSESNHTFNGNQIVRWQYSTCKH